MNNNSYQKFKEDHHLLKKEERKIIILMSVYNGDKYIQDQLESIYNQTFIKNVKLLIRDDGSIDRTIEIINNWKNKLKITLITGDNLGPARSFFELLRKAEDADYYAYCDQDDFWLENKLERAILNIEQIKDYRATPILSYSNAKYVDENLQPLGKNIHSNVPLYSYKNIIAGNNAAGCTMVFNKALKEILCSFESRHFTMHDKTTMLVAALLGRIVYDFEPTMLYRQHASNVTKSSGDLTKKIKLTYKRWFKNIDTSIALEASEHLSSFGEIVEDEERYFLELFATYKTNLKSRLKIIFNKEITSSNPKFTRTFKIKVLLGLA